MRQSLERIDERPARELALEPAELLGRDDDDLVAPMNGDVLRAFPADALHELAEAGFLWGCVSDPLILVTNKDMWESWTAADRDIVRQAAVDAGKQEIDLARKGLAEADQPLPKEIAGNGVNVVKLTPLKRDAFVTATRRVYAKWKAQIGAPLGNRAEKDGAARKR